MSASTCSERNIAQSRAGVNAGASGGHCSRLPEGDDRLADPPPEEWTPRYAEWVYDTTVGGSFLARASYPIQT
jgi:hypothetical protein